jgi:predicted  nucleic acid-binding Zn-ribbon protein
MTALSIGEWIAIIASLVAIGVSVIKTKPEIRSINGETAESYSQAARNYADEVVNLQTRLTKAEQSLASVMGEVNDLRKQNEDLREWAERLTHQIKSLGAEPVAIRMRVDGKI